MNDYDFLNLFNLMRLIQTKRVTNHFDNSLNILSLRTIS